MRGLPLKLGRKSVYSPVKKEKDSEQNDIAVVFHLEGMDFGI